MADEDDFDDYEDDDEGTVLPGVEFDDPDALDEDEDEDFGDEDE